MGRIPVMSFTSPLDSEAMLLLQKIYGSVCQALRLTPDPATGESATAGSLRRELYAALVAAALAGERDPLVLKERALAVARPTPIKP